MTQFKDTLDEIDVFSNVNNFTIAVGRYTVDKGLCMPFHLHSELEILYVNKGQMLYSFGEEKHILNEGEIMFINSKTEHSLEALSEKCTHSYLHFKEPIFQKESPEYILRFLKMPDNGFYHFTMKDAETKIIADYINSAVDDYEVKETHYDYYVNGIVSFILSIIYKKGIMTSYAKGINLQLLNKLNPVLEYINEHYAEDLTLSDLSEILHLNEQYFCKLFKKITGSNVIDYINCVRIHNAEKLIKTNMSITEIAGKVGFSSISYFNKIFKKHLIKSPSKYRKIYVRNRH